MYPARFNLRDFMSHLAPGGYYFLYFLIFASLPFWILAPVPTKELAGKVGGASTPVITISFAVFIVLCYFTGVVLRLPSVDKIDIFSIEYKLRREFRRQSSGTRGETPRSSMRVSDFFTALKLWLRPIDDPLMLSDVRKVLDDVEEVAGEVRKVLDDVEEGADEVRKVLDDVEEGTDNSPLADPDERFRDWVRFLAAEGLKEAETPDAETCIKSETLRDFVATELVSKWLWIADRFPYPLSFTHKVHLRSTPARQKEFAEHLWEPMVEAMRGEISGKRTSKESFNRCKMTLRAHSEELAADVYDREALTRMMAGFFVGLRFGAVGSMWAAAVLTVLSFLNLGLGLSYSGRHLAVFVLFFVVSFGFNNTMLHNVVKSFHSLRLSESQAVFDGFVLIKTGDYRDAPSS
ncbi:MAG: hypothetical protein GY722_12025 [bacterium]|nr:hypothetical protein [bacterium]